MKKVCTLDQLETLVNGVDALAEDQLKELMVIYPFEDMISINIMNAELLKTQVSFLVKLSHKNVFYEDVKPILHIVKFILAIISALEITDSGEILSSCVELLRRIIASTKDNGELREFVQNGREKIIEVLAKTTKQRTFSPNHVSACTSILSDLLSMSGMLPTTTSGYLAEIVEIFKGLNVVHELAVICNIVLKKFSLSTEVFDVCISWLLRNDANFLREELEEITLKELMTATNYFYIKFNYIRYTKKHQNSDIVKHLRNFLDAMSHASDKILLMSQKQELQEESFKLFSILLSEYNGQKWDVNLETLNGLPKDIMEWPKKRIIAFFQVCGFLCRYSRLVWRPSEVLQSITHLIYSHERFRLDVSMFKTICTIYPIIMVDCRGKNCAILGDDLLIMMSRRFYEFSNIFTCHVAQLCWILQCGSIELKKHALCHWLRHEENVELLMRCLVACKAGTVLLRIIVDHHVEEEISDRAIRLINMLQDSDISATIAMMVCAFYTDRKLLRRFVLSNPGVPEDKDTALKICEFMSLLLPSIEDETVFGVACAYSKNLLVSLKTKPDILKVFCKDMRNVKFLLIKLKKVKDETAVQVLGLLKILVLVQKRNHTHLEDKLVTDFAPSLLGSLSKMEKCLDLLHLIISNDLFIELSPLKVQAIFLKLLDLYKTPEMAVKCMICMTEILKTNRWLAFMSCTNLFIEVNCSIEVMESSWQEFVVFLGCWMKILKDAKGRETVYVAHAGIVRNYLLRVPSLPQTRVTYMLKVLRQLDKLDSSRMAALM